MRYYVYRCVCTNRLSEVHCYGYGAGEICESADVKRSDEAIGRFSKEWGAPRFGRDGGKQQIPPPSLALLLRSE